MKPTPNVDFELEQGIIKAKNYIARFDHPNDLYKPIDTFTKKCCISVAFPKTMNLSTKNTLGNSGILLELIKQPKL